MSFKNIKSGPYVSEWNSSTSTLTNGSTFTGEAEDVSNWASVVAAVKTDQSGTLYMEFSPDGTNWDSSLSFTVSAATNEVHRLSITRKFYRVRFTNGSGSNQTYFRLQSIYGDQPALTSTLNSTVSSDNDSLVTRSVLMGQTDGGIYKFVPVTAEGHVEVALHDPRLPFGSIHTENLTPIFQTDAVYGVNSGQVTTFSTLSGSATASDSAFVVSTGTTNTAQGVILGRKRLRYRPGQGVVGRFTALFTTPAAYSYQIAGFGHAEDGVYFGYREIAGSTPSFGILYVNRGIREVRTLTITTKSTTAENITVKLNDVNNTVAVTDATSGTLYKTVWEIAQGSYSGWDAYPIGATVVFVRKAVGTASGTYSITATTAQGTFAQTKAGAASTDTFVAQSSWNGDVMDGTGSSSNPSGFLLDPTKGNVYQIGIQYLGFGSIQFQIETTATDNNNANFVTVHTLKFPNTLTASSFGNPSFPFTMAAYSAGSTTNLTVKCGSFAGFIEGGKMLHGNRFSYFNQLGPNAVAASVYHALFTVLNTRYYGGRTNQAVINLLSVNAAIKHTSPVILYLIKNGNLVGNPNFTAYASNSCSAWDTAATSVTFSTNDQVIWSGHLGDTGEIDHNFMSGLLEEVTLQPGEWLTLAAKTSTGTASYVTGSVNTREDQ